MRRVPRFYHLHKPKLRQTWNKHNVYNLSRSVGREPMINRMATFFQQKWSAKSRTRAYHGDHIQEKKWKRLFSRRLLSVVDMPPKYLATYDGSEQATGRGSGLLTNSVTAEEFSQAPTYKPEDPYSGRRGDVNKLLAMQYSKMTPYMQMTYAPLERRLETAVYRALFASSIREARQFCVHGAVKVNGLKMVYPAYELNPGDMFEVDVEKVMYATGTQKKTQEDPRIKPPTSWRRGDDRLLKQEWSRLVQATASDNGEMLLGKKVWERHKTRIGDGPVTQPYLRQMMVESALERALSVFQKRQERQDEKAPRKKKEDRESEDCYEKQRIRLLIRTARSWLCLPDDWEMPAGRLINALWQLFPNPQWIPRLKMAWLKKQNPKRYGELTSTLDAEMLCRLGMNILDIPEMEKLGEMYIGPVLFTWDEVLELVREIEEVSNNTPTGKEPYVMPWRPRPFMSAFCFIPRYLEVNPYICAAVYLRHPVARKGLAEVPTPFNYLTSQLAHNWYLERG
ncbi:hypothetical protein CP533_1901 [Ophiocordyceps camponoti-saundersi (nom. inval.)]|nr:hypothetical protein CP533_1901 [Ophiocordyceps camponoti-saundersi (nom. inval.)]